jgi:hypothetical protein
MEDPYRILPKRRGPPEPPRCTRCGAVDPKKGQVCINPAKLDDGSFYILCTPDQPRLYSRDVIAKALGVPKHIVARSAGKLNLSFDLTEAEVSWLVESMSRAAGHTILLNAQGTQPKPSPKPQPPKGPLRVAPYQAEPTSKGEDE